MDEWNGYRRRGEVPEALHEECLERVLQVEVEVGVGVGDKREV